MRFYATPLEMVREVERDLYEMGTRVLSQTVQDQVGDRWTRELVGYSYAVNSHEKVDEMVAYLKGRHEWILEESHERIGTGLHAMTPTNPGVAWELARDLWEPFLRDGKFAYSYPERVRWQLPYVIDELRRRPGTRQAVITMYGAERDIMNWGGRDRVPCSLTWHALLREDKLVLIYSQRSCDFLKFFVHDVYFGMFLQRYLANAIGAVTGQFIHNINSLHAFEDDLKARGIF